MKIFGHRGAPGFPRYGENTIRSFRKALEDGADGVEFDVRRCGDGSIVVIHDATVDRTTDGTGRVADLPYDILRKVDAGCGEPIPRLADVFTTLAGESLLNIELKEQGMAADVKRLVLDSGSARRVIVSAFDFDDNDVGSNSSWDDLSLLCPEVPIALLATARKVSRIGVKAFIGQATRYGAAAIHPHRTAPIRDLTAAAHAASLRVHVWTVNQASEGSLFREFGVDAIFTDFPEKFRDI